MPTSVVSQGFPNITPLNANISLSNLNFHTYELCTTCLVDTYPKVSVPFECLGATYTSLGVGLIGGISLYFSHLYSHRSKKIAALNLFLGLVAPLMLLYSIAPTLLIWGSATIVPVSCILSGSYILRFIAATGIYHDLLRDPEKFNVEGNKKWNSRFNQSIPLGCEAFKPYIKPGVSYVCSLLNEDLQGYIGDKFIEKSTLLLSVASAWVFFDYYSSKYINSKFISKIQNIPINDKKIRDDVEKFWKPKDELWTGAALKVATLGFKYIVSGTAKIIFYKSPGMEIIADGLGAIVMISLLEYHKLKKEELNGLGALKRISKIPKIEVAYKTGIAVMLDLIGNKIVEPFLKLSLQEYWTLIYYPSYDLSKDVAGDVIKIYVTPKLTPRTLATPNVIKTYVTPRLTPRTLATTSVTLTVADAKNSVRPLSFTGSNTVDALTPPPTSTAILKAASEGHSNGSISQSSEGARLFSGETHSPKGGEVAPLAVSLRETVRMQAKAQVLAAAATSGDKRAGPLCEDNSIIDSDDRKIILAPLQSPSAVVAANLGQPSAVSEAIVIPAPASTSSAAGESKNSLFPTASVTSPVVDAKNSIRPLSFTGSNPVDALTPLPTSTAILKAASEGHSNGSISQSSEGARLFSGETHSPKGGEVAPLAVSLRETVRMQAKAQVLAAAATSGDKRAGPLCEDNSIIDSDDRKIILAPLQSPSAVVAANLGQPSAVSEAIVIPAPAPTNSAAGESKNSLFPTGMEPASVDEKQVLGNNIISGMPNNALVSSDKNGMQVTIKKQPVQSVALLNPGVSSIQARLLKAANGGKQKNQAPISELSVDRKAGQASSEKLSLRDSQTSVSSSDRGSDSQTSVSSSDRGSNSQTSVSSSDRGSDSGEASLDSTEFTFEGEELRYEETSSFRNAQCSRPAIVRQPQNKLTHTRELRNMHASSSDRRSDSGEASLDSTEFTFEGEELRYEETAASSFRNAQGSRPAIVRQPQNKLTYTRELRNMHAETAASSFRNAQCLQPVIVHPSQNALTHTQELRNMQATDNVNYLT